MKNLGNVLALSAAVLSVSLLTACGGSSSSSGRINTDIADTTPPPTMNPEVRSATGRVIDGYVSGATVCGDTNDNRVCDTGELRTQSGAQGAYTLTEQSQGLLLATGGRNNDTMSANELILFSPVKSSDSPSLTRQITPLTTLAAVFAGQAADPDEYAVTAAVIRQAFGLSSSFNLYQDDPIALANDTSRSSSQRSAALAVHRLGVQVANTVITSFALDGRRDVQAQNQAFAAIAALLALNNGEAPDLTNEAQLRRVLLLSSEVDPTDAQVTRLAQANGAVASAPTTALVGSAQNAYVTSLNTDPTMDNPGDNGNGNGADPEGGAGGDDTSNPNDMNGDGNGNGNNGNPPPPEMPDDGAGVPDFLSPTALCAIPVLGELLVDNVFSMLPGFTGISCPDTGDDAGAIGGTPSLGDIPVLGEALADPLSMIPVIGPVLAGDPAPGDGAGGDVPELPGLPASPEDFFALFAGGFEQLTALFPTP